ncbi:neurexin-1b [Hydra vulgaris]|uniref:neurexin-1b n=1 Tax=Hydra vulgaris TaxID=6087 RepID=UPI001F5EE607|nr:neurexin-1b [Hydra vulgaris]
MTWLMFVSINCHVFIYIYVNISIIYSILGYQLNNIGNGVQYLEYEPWSDNPRYGEASLQFLFKTNVPKGVLLTVASKGDHKLQIFLDEGKLHVLLVMGGKNIVNQKNIHIGKQWNDMKWHTVKLTRRFRIVTISIDNMEETLISNGKIPDRLNVDSAHLYIGWDPDQNNEGFTGCIINISYPIGSNPKEPDHVVGEVKDECDDECTDKENTCLNGGKCVKNLDKSKPFCDCSGTGMTGESCSKEVPVVYFNGSSFVSFPVQPFEHFRKNKISFRFRTTEPNGLIITSGNSQRHFIVELNRGNIQANISMGADSIVVLAGNSALHDGIFHSVIIEIFGPEVVLSVDRESFPKSYVDQKFLKYQPTGWMDLKYYSTECTDEYKSLEEDEERFYIFVGGYPYVNTLLISASKVNYNGCLQQLLIESQNLDVVEKIVFEKKTLIEGQLLFNCPVKENKNVDNLLAIDGNIKSQLQTMFKSKLSQTTVAWITGGICVGTVALILMLACGFHKIRNKYNGQFLTHKGGNFFHTREALEKINGRVAKEFYLISSRDNSPRIFDGSPRIFESPFRRDVHGAVV